MTFSLTPKFGGACSSMTNSFSCTSCAGCCGAPLPQLLFLPRSGWGDRRGPWWRPPPREPPPPPELWENRLWRLPCLASPLAMISLIFPTATEIYYNLWLTQFHNIKTYIKGKKTTLLIQKIPLKSVLFFFQQLFWYQNTRSTYN